MNRIALSLAVVAAAVAVALLTLAIDPSFNTFVELPPAEPLLPAAQAVSRPGAFVGAEHFAQSPIDGLMYAGLLDGRIVRFDSRADKIEPELFVRTGDDCTKVFAVGEASSDATHSFGRPLGLAFEASGLLWVSDAYAGILAIHPNGTIERHVSEIEGEPLVFANGIVIEPETGIIYFTQLSRKYPIHKVFPAVMGGARDGRVLSYDRVQKKVTVLAEGLPCSNGLAMTKSGDALIFAQSAQMSLAKLWLKGPNAGELVSPLGGGLLPAFVDNIDRTDRGTFWVGASRLAKPYMQMIMRRPALRKMLINAPKWVVTVPDHAILFEVTEEGKVLRVLEDKTSNIIGAAGANEMEDGTLWLQSFCSPTIVRTKL